MTEVRITENACIRYNGKNYTSEDDYFEMDEKDLGPVEHLIQKKGEKKKISKKSGKK